MFYNNFYSEHFLFYQPILVEKSCLEILLCVCLYNLKNLMIDSIQHKGQRKRLVELLRKKGISDEKVLNAINSVPRHLFMSDLSHFAYEDKAFPIGAEQTISQPYTVAFQTQLLEIKRGEKILEIGTGSGYQSAVLIEMGAKVYTIERILELYSKTQILLPQIGYNPQFFYGDGYLGKPTYGPFDKILITAGAPSIPTELLKQLKIGGFLVAPIGLENCQVMTKITKLDETNFQKQEFGNFAFVPMIKGLK